MRRSNPGALQRSKSGADFLQLHKTDAPTGGLSLWLTGRLRQAIGDGRLPVGSRLPATRTLAEELGVSRGVVTEAYQRLAEEGHVAGRSRAGTIVVARPTAVLGPVIPGLRRDAFVEPPDSAVFDALRAAPARIDLSPGTPDLAAFPRSAWLRAERSVLNDLSPASFGYGDPRGAPAFRAAVANWLARTRSISVSADEVIVVAGVAQSLALLARTLLQEGHSTIAVEDPGSLGSRQQLQSWGMATPPIPVDEEGLQVEQLRSSAAPIVMLTPAHQFPTGVVLGGARRRELRRWAQGGGLIIEDDYDAEHRYDRPPVPALRATLAEQVFYTGSVSKLLAPALRVGWLVAPARFQDRLVTAKREADLGNAVLPQLVLAELMSSGDLERQLRFVRRRHRRRRDAMIRAIADQLPQAVVHGAAAGLHLTITFGVSVPDVALAQAALARGVKVQPLSWHTQATSQTGLVLGYAASSATEIERGLTEIAEVFRGMT